MSRPVVTHFNTNIFLNSVVKAQDLFSVTDEDGDAIRSLFVEDYQSDPTGGFFRLNGVAFENGSQFRVEIEDLPNLEYVSGSRIGWEGFRVIALDVAGEISTPANSGRLYTVRENTSRPIVNSRPFEALANEATDLGNIVSAFDPDGYPITQYWLRDRSVDEGFLTLNGVALEQGEFSLVKSEDLSGLQYNTVGLESTEKLDIFAYDGELWSVRGSYDVTTVQNVNRPVAQFTRGDVESRADLALADVTLVTDDDGNSIKYYEFFNTSPHSQHGELVFKGVVQPRKEWVRVQNNELDQMVYRAPNQDFVQQIRVRGFDGKFLSNNGTISITTEFVNPPVQPRLTPVVPEVDVRQLQFFDVSSLFAVDGSTKAPFEFQLVDDNSGIFSGGLRLDNEPLAANVVHTMDVSNFGSVEYQSGAYVVRTNEQIYARANNDIWSRWERIEFQTEPEFDQAFFTNQINPVSWNNFLPRVNGKTRITYSYMQTFPDYNTGEAVNNDDPPEQFRQFTPPQIAGAESVFANLEDFANVEFVQISDTDVNELGQRGGIIRMGNYFIEDSDAGAFAFFPSSAPEGGDIWMNNASVSLTDWSQGSYSYTTFAHELGHAMGLKHPHGGNSAGQPGGQEGAPWLPDSADDQRFSVMTYTFGPAFAWTFQVYDIYNLQRLYGANMTVRTEDNVYDFDFMSNDPAALQAVWDAGGTDEISAAGTSANAVIDLRDGQFSTIGGFGDNLGLAFDVEIENGTGGTGNDLLIGNHLDNVFVGGDGNDQIWGGAGNDLLTGGVGNDIFEWGVADHNDIIDEMRGAGVDTIQLTDFPQLDSLEDDLRFRMEGRDLIIDLSLDNGLSEGTLRVSNQLWGRYRVETLDLAGTRIDLRNLTEQISLVNDSFRISEDSSDFGNLVVPV